MMEFNYCATDNKPPLTFTPPPNFSYSPHQPIQGDMGWGFNGYYMEGPNSAIEMSQFLWREMEKAKIREEILMESVWTQIEKERIREEVIVDEIVRRRLLEEDVRRELILERELALRGGGQCVIGQRGIPAPLLPSEMVGRPFGQRFGNSLDGMLGMPSVLRHESGGLVTGRQMSAEPHIFEGKPQLRNGKQKEKIVLPAKPLQDVDVCVLSSACSEKRQLREEWSCALCQVTASCEQGLNEHLQGKRHKAKEAGLRKKTNNYKIGFTESTSSKDAPSMGSKLLKKRDQSIAKSAELWRPSQNSRNVKGNDYLFDDSTNNNEATVGETKNSTGNKNNACTFWCETCQVGVATLKDMEEHSAGKKHLSQCLKNDQNTQQVGQKLTVTGNEGIDGNKSTSEDVSPVVHMVELEGQQKKEVDVDPETSSVNPEKKGDPLVIASQQLGDHNSVMNSEENIARTQVNKKNSLRFWCDLCQVGADTEKVMEIHKTGKKHLSRSRLPDSKKSASEDQVELEDKQVDSETSSVDPEKTVDPLIQLSQLSGNSVNNCGTPIARTQENKNSLRFWCDVCQVGADAEKVMEIHKAGKKHLSWSRLQDSKKSASEDLTAVVQKVELEGKQVDSETSSVNPEKTVDPLIHISQQSGNSVNNSGTPIARTQENKKNSLRFWCDICQVGADTEKVMEIHKAGKKHLSRPRLPDIEKSASEDLSAVVHKVELEAQQVDSETSSMKPEKTVHPLIVINQQLGNTVNNSGQPIARTQENKKNSLRFWCDICQVGADTEKVMKIHRTGKKHLARKQMFRFWCDVCQVGADTEKAMDTHKAGKKHLCQPRLPVINQNPGNLPPNFSIQSITGAEANSLDTNVGMKKKMPMNQSQFRNICIKKNEAQVRRIKETSGLKKNSSTYWCEMCHVRADSKEEIEAHWYGKKHQKVINSLVGEK